MKRLARIPSILVLLIATWVSHAGEITDTYATGDTLTATTMDNIKAAVNDNDGRITTNSQSVTTLQTDIGTLQTNVGSNQTSISGIDARLVGVEDALTTRATGKFFIPSGAFLPTSGTSLFNTLPDGVTTSMTATTGEPGDYFSAGSGDVTYRFLFSGCDGSTVRLQLQIVNYQIGLNNTLLIVPPSRDVSIPASGLFQFNIVAEDVTSTGFQDQVNVRVSRFGADAADTCATDLSLRGVIVEYPTAVP